MAKPVKVRTAAGEWADLAIQVPSANDPTFTGTTSSSQFNSTQSSGDEGGEIKFSKSATNTTLDTGVTLDVYQDKVRLFETGGTNRGGYFDMTTLSTGVGTNLAPGLTLINKTDFSASSSVSINNCFSSTYDNYRIIISGFSSSTNPSSMGGLLLRLRASGTDSSASYNWGYRYWNYSGANTIATSGGDSRMRITDFGNLETNLVTVDIASPFLAKRTAFSVFGMGWGTDTSQGGDVQGDHLVTSSYDGVTIYPNSGTITGTVRVYGYRNS